MRVSLRSWVIWPVLSLLFVGAGLCDEQGSSPCDYIYVIASQEEGPTYVFNFMDQPITFDLQTVQNICSSSQCTFTSTRNNVVLAAGDVAAYDFVPDDPNPICLDVFCCGSGSRGIARATLTLPAGRCQVE